MSDDENNKTIEEQKEDKDEKDIGDDDSQPEVIIFSDSEELDENDDEIIELKDTEFILFK